MFVLAGRAWELRLGFSSLQGLCDRGQRRLLDGLLLLSTEIVRSPGSVCQEQVVIQAVMRAALPPTATARRQHSLRQGEVLVYCQSVSEMPHVLKTSPSCYYAGPRQKKKRSLGLEVVSRLQKVKHVIRCKLPVEWRNHSWPIFHASHLWDTLSVIFGYDHKAHDFCHERPALCPSFDTVWTPDMSGVHNPRLQAVNFHCTVNIQNGLYTTLWPDHKLFHSLHLYELQIYKQSTHSCQMSGMHFLSTDRFV